MPISPASGGSGQRGPPRLSEAARATLPERITGQGATRRGGRHRPAHAEPPRCRTRHPEGTGRSRPRPGEAHRQRRFAGGGPTPSRPATCGFPGSHARARFALHKPPDVKCAPPDRQRTPPSGARIRAPGCGSVEAVRFLNDRDVPASDGVLEALDLAPGGLRGPQRRVAGSWRRCMPCPTCSSAAVS